MFQAPKGTIDILPSDVNKWRFVEKTIENTCRNYGFQEIRTPMFEYTDLFLRGVGDTTDVVQKEMYTFTDKAERSLSLRPEGTASAVRAYLQHSLYSFPPPTKLFYVIPCFRYENTQSGRQRQFHQFGVETLGSDQITSDAEIIHLAAHFFTALGLPVKLKISSIGCKKCRSEFIEHLIGFLTPCSDSLCGTCLKRLVKNPLRILDCKNAKCKKIAQDAPKLLYHLCTECDDHFKELLQYLDKLNVTYSVDDGIVRGLDYYTRTVFEFTTDVIGAQGTICGGGRYDHLIEDLGGKPTAGIGFAIGLERLLILLEKSEIPVPETVKPALFIANICQNMASMELASKLRALGVYCEIDHCGRSLKSQMKYADKMGAQFCIVLGENEVATNSAQLKDMSDGSAVSVTLDPTDISSKIEERLKPHVDSV